MNRNNTLDVLKGLAILLVVLGHAIQKNTAHYELNAVFGFIYSFHMPLFFIISGYLTCLTIKSRRLDWLSGKAIYLLAPHIVFNIIYFFASATGLTIFSDQTIVYSFPEWLKAAFLFNSGEWFLWVLFVVLALLLAVNYMDRWFPGFIFWLFCAGLVALLLLLPDYGKDYLRLYELQLYFPFALLGYMTARSRGFPGLWLLLAALAAITYPLYVSHVDWTGAWALLPNYNLAFQLERGTPLSYLVRYPQAMLGIGLATLLALALSRWRAAAGILARLGRLTLGIYLFHMFFSGLHIGSGGLAVVSAFISSLTLAIMLTLLFSRIGIIRRVWLKGAAPDFPAPAAKQLKR